MSQETDKKTNSIKRALDGMAESYVDWCFDKLPPSIAEPVCYLVAYIVLSMLVFALIVLPILFIIWFILTELGVV